MKKKNRDLLVEYEKMIKPKKEIPETPLTESQIFHVGGEFYITDESGFTKKLGDIPSLTMTSDSHPAASQEIIHTTYRQPEVSMHIEYTSIAPNFWELLGIVPPKKQEAEK